VVLLLQINDMSQRLDTMCLPSCIIPYNQEVQEHNRRNSSWNM